MRYYKIVITNADGKVIRNYTSFNDGATNMSALDIEIDISVSPTADPFGDGASFVRIWGIPLSDVSQASNFNMMKIKVYGGMQAGLPLANPKQAGLLVSGLIFQSFGNWVGIDQTLDFYISIDAGDNDSPKKNIVLNWMAGTPLANALTSTLKTAYPGFSVDTNIKSTLIQSHDEQGFYFSLKQLAQRVKEMSQSIVGGAYTGVEIVMREKSFAIYDGTSPSSPKQLVFTDLIGQPTWIGPNTINMQVVMRSDILPGVYVKLPPRTLTTNTQQAFTQARDSSVFQGSFYVSTVRHIGRFRQPDASSWLTVMDMSASGS